MWNRREFLASGAMLITAAPGLRAGAGARPFLDRDAFKHHIDFFNGLSEEGVVNHIPDAEAWPWLHGNIPFFECPDADFERTWYYRWWSYRKHIKKTADGFVVTEFLRPVKHATSHNAISCAFGHHLAEGRWLHEPMYLREYANFWLRSGAQGGLQPRFHQYSGWAADALYRHWLVTWESRFLTGLLDALLLDYRTWEEERRLDSGLFWQYDVRDGMEESGSGSRTAKNARPTINSYMYGNARALARIAALCGDAPVEREYRAKAARLQELVETHLWDAQARFFKARLETGALAGIREEIGFIPWYFHLPAAGRGTEAAWKQLMDPEGFFAPYGPTTAERRHPAFAIAFEGDDCQWNGPSWPFATAQTLTAMANLLHDYRQAAVSKRDYFETLRIYTLSQRRKLEDGRIIPWIDENLNPFTGEWHARALKIRKGRFDGRGDHYNHSTYCDLVITGLIGLRPRPDDVIEVRPLLPGGTWDWFCLDRVKYHGRLLTILWDRTGRRYGRGTGLRLYADGREISRSPSLEHGCRSGR